MKVSRAPSDVQPLAETVLGQANRTEHPPRVVLSGCLPEQSLQYFGRTVSGPAIVRRARLTQQRIGQQYSCAGILRMLSQPLLHLADPLTETVGRGRRAARHSD